MALSYRSSIAVNGGAATVTTLTPTLPTGWAANDLIYFCFSIGSTLAGQVTPAGWTTAWTANSDATGFTLFAYRTMQTSDTAPAFSWTNLGKWAYTGICIQPAAGQLATHSGLAGPTVNATATSHTSPAFAAGALSGCSVLLTGYRGGSNTATGVTTTAPTNWTEPASNADTTTAAGTTSALRQMAAWHAYRLAQTATITPTAQTASITAVANLYHAFAIETSATPFLPPKPMLFRRIATFRSNDW